MPDVLKANLDCAKTALDTLQSRIGFLDDAIDDLGEISKRNRTRYKELLAEIQPLRSAEAGLSSAIHVIELLQEAVRTGEYRLRQVHAVGHWDECMFCGFKDAAANGKYDGKTVEGEYKFSGLTLLPPNNTSTGEGQ